MRPSRWPHVSHVAAAIYLGALTIVLATAWQSPEPAVAQSAATGARELHLLLIMMLGTIIAIMTLARGDGAQNACQPADCDLQSEQLRELMAHMSHALRTPLNAVIGFSEVMARELHGPLGNSRYQEYANHIRESGGQLLRSSEVALAVTEAMTELIAEGTRGRRERVALEALLRDAWSTVAPEGDAQSLILSGVGKLEISCERRATAQALEHLLAEARQRSGDAVEVSVRPYDARLDMHIRLGGDGSTTEGVNTLRIFVARLLLRTQGATFDCCAEDSHCSIVVGLPSP